jgi:hypothetical protein
MTKEKIQKRKNLLSVRFSHIRNMEEWERAVFEKRLSFLDRKKYLGFIEEKVYTTPKGRIIIEKDLIEGTPTKRFRDTIKKAGLLDTKFGEKKKSG